MWGWCECINLAFRRLLAVVVRAVLSQHAVNIPNKPLKNTVCFAVFLWDWGALHGVVRVVGLDMTRYLDFLRRYGKIYT